MTRGCYVCTKAATVRVTASTLTGKTTYLACPDHDPRHIPGGDVVVIRSEELRAS